MSIVNQTFISAPTNILRSSLFSVVGITNFICGLSFTSQTSWQVSEVNSLNSTIRTLDLSTNPTASTSEIVFSKGVLSYGLYRFTMTVSVTYTWRATLTTVASQVETYIRINPTGLAVFGLPNGVGEMTYGSAQKIDVNPGLYSIDFDSVVNPASLTYNVYCRIIPKTDTSDFGEYINNASQSLFYPVGPYLNFISVSYNGQPCFNVSSNH